MVYNIVELLVSCYPDLPEILDERVSVNLLHWFDELDPEVREGIVSCLETLRDKL